MAGDRSGASHGSTGRAIPMVTALRNITGQRTWAWPIRAGRIRTTRSFMTMDDSRRDRSRWLKSKATSTRPSCSLPGVQGGLAGNAGRSISRAKPNSWRRALRPPSGARRSTPMSLPSTARNSPVGYAPRMRDSCSSPASPSRSAPRRSSVDCWRRTCSRVGASARSRTGSSGTIPCPITTVQSGRMTTLSLLLASRDTDTRRRSSRYSKACLRLRPIWSCAAFRSCSAGFSAGGDAVQRSIRSPVRRRPGQAGRFS